MVLSSAVETIGSKYFLEDLADVQFAPEFSLFPPVCTEKKL